MPRPNDFISTFKSITNNCAGGKFLSPSTERSPGVLEKWIDDLEDQAAAMTRALHDLDGPPMSPVAPAVPCVHHQPPSDCVISGPGSLDDWVLGSFRGKELLHSPRPKSVSSLPNVESCPSCSQCRMKVQQKQLSSPPEDDPSLSLDDLAACPALEFLQFQISRLRVSQRSLERELALRAKIISEQDAAIAKLRSNALENSGGNRRSWDMAKFCFDDDTLLRELEAVRQKVLDLEKRNVELDERCFRLELENDSLKRARNLPFEHVCK